MIARRPLVLLALIGCLGLSACQAESSSGPAPIGSKSDAPAPVDPALLAFLSRAKSAHHLADNYEEDEQIDKAIDPLQRLVDGPAPGGSGPSSRAEVREVLADTLARIADLKSQLGRFDEANKDLDRGLDLARETTYFRGHLFEVRGLVEERRSKQLKDSGASAEAEAAKKRALDAFEKSMSIQAEVIQKAVPDEDAK